jgi:hypothetical protein
LVVQSSEQREQRVKVISGYTNLYEQKSNGYLAMYEKGDAKSEMPEPSFQYFPVIKQNISISRAIAFLVIFQQTIKEMSIPNL